MGIVVLCTAVILLAMKGSWAWAWILLAVTIVLGIVMKVGEQ